MNKTDTQLQHDVQAELMWDPAVTDTHIGVESDKGVITLSGHVPTFAEKWAAERAALRVGGVTAIAVEVKVDLADPGKHSDADISRSVSNVLQLMAPEYSQQVKAMVEQGWLTLSGDVEWNFQRNAAVRLVSHVMGVRGVSNAINIRPKLIARSVREEVRAALQRRAIQDIDSITIAIDGPDITLGGTVHSWSEKALAKHAAACMPGVRDVIDKVTVTI
jgi:osmotically-inducible protein OsmY